MRSLDPRQAIVIVALYGLGYPLGALAVAHLNWVWVLASRFVIGGALLLAVAAVRRVVWPTPRLVADMIAVGLLTQFGQFVPLYVGLSHGVSPTLSAPLAIATAAQRPLSSLARHTIALIKSELAHGPVREPAARRARASEATRTRRKRTT